MNPTIDGQSVGSELGLGGVEQVVERAEAICEHEVRRIELTNEARITALQAEIGSLGERERDLQERRRRAALPGEERSRRRKAWYHRTVAFVLTLAGFFFSLLAFAPYRLGPKSYLYCVGIAVVTPFAVEKFLEEWASRHLVKALVLAAFLTSMTSLVLLAVIRGDLLSEQTTAAEPVVVVQGEGPAPVPSPTTFYERTLVFLRILMALLSVAMELGAGIALREAVRLGTVSGESYHELSQAIESVRAEMVARLCEFTALTNEAAIFAARFWRDFYRSMLTHTTRNALQKLLIVVLGVLFLLTPKGFAQDHLNLVILLDLTKSVAVKGADGETEFKENVEGVSRVLATVPSGTSVTVAGITDRSFAQPLVLLRAEIPGDPGYFGERIRSARNQIVAAWHTRCAHLEPRFEYSDVIGSLFLASQIFGSQNDSRKVLVMFSDMRHHTGDLDLESPALLSERTRARKMPKSLVASLDNVHVYALGVDGAGKGLAYWNSLHEYWSEYFQSAGARMMAYSVLREQTVVDLRNEAGGAGANRQNVIEITDDGDSQIFLVAHTG